ncbi:MAG: NAD(+)/NADH kinase [Bacillota bacterium]
MQTFSIIPNLDKVRALETSQALVNWLEERGLQVRLEKEIAAMLNRPELGHDEAAIMGGVDVIIVLGGDGTLLNVAKKAAAAESPILGVNLGHLGFLTEIELPDLFSSLERVVNGRYLIERRMMVEAEVRRQGRQTDRFLALNEVVISKGPFARLINLETYVDDNLVASYPGDGLIVATPTGSTAYSFSAGGPIVSPSIDVLVITPICPHSFYARSVIVSRDETVRVQVRASHRETMITIDGQRGYYLRPEDEIVVRRSQEEVRLIRLEGWSFYDVLRRKLRSGDQERNQDV